MYQQIGQAIRNWQVSRNIKPAKIESRSTSCEIKSLIKKNSLKTKSMTRWLHWGILPNIQRIYTWPSQTIPKSSKRGNTPKFILWSHHHPGIKTRQRHYKKESNKPVFLTNIDAKFLNKNVSKPNPTIHKKDHTPRSSWIHSRVSRMV